MKYESRAARQKLGRLVSFQPGPKRGENLDQFGVFDSGDTNAQCIAGMKEKELDAFIQGTQSYKSGQIWLASARIEKETGASESKARDTVVRGMNESQLRAVIAASGVAVPGEGVEKAELEDIAAKCLAGVIKAGTVIESPAVAEETSAGEDVSKKPIKKK